MRDDFSESVKRALASRVGNRCSNPQCRALTSGPTVDPSKALNVGVAAHITAASTGGPRFDPKFTPAERANANNGLWLCQNCAKMIDNDSQRFSSELLRAWKLIAEEEALRSIGKSASVDIKGDDPVAQASKRVAGLTLAQTVAMTFVDQMRLLYTASSTIAADANDGRQDEFLRMGRRHFDELGRQVAQFSASIAPHSHKELVAITRRMSYALDELQGVMIQQPRQRIFGEMRKLAQLIANFCASAAAEYYGEVDAAVDELSKRYAPDLAQRAAVANFDELYLLRLQLQTHFIEDYADVQELPTIAFDMDHKLAVPYFMIDRKILDWMRL